MVRYKAEADNIRLEVLSNCTARSLAYLFSPYAAKESKVMASEAEVMAKLPLGVTTLGGRVKNSRAVRTDAMLVGTYGLPVAAKVDRSVLVGECAGATHAVSQIWVGGFALATGASGEIVATASVFEAKAAGSVSIEQVEGNVEACRKSMTSGAAEPLCSVPLRVGLMMLSEQTPAESCEPGHTFEAGRGCVKVLQPETFDLLKDMALRYDKNPNGAWSFGSAPNPTGTIEIGRFFEFNKDANAPDLAVWSALPAGGDRAALQYNSTDSTTPHPGVAIPPKHISLHPMSSTALDYAAVVWRAPRAGNAQIEAAFHAYDINGTTTDVHVVGPHGERLFSDAVEGYPVSKNYRGTVPVKMGEEIRFLVGPGANKTHYGDNTGFEARVVLNPQG